MTITEFLQHVKEIKLQHMESDRGLCWCAEKPGNPIHPVIALREHMGAWLGDADGWISDKVEDIDKGQAEHRFYMAIANQIRIDWLDASIALGAFAALPTDDEVKEMLRKARAV